MTLRKNLTKLVYATILLFLSSCSSMYIPAMPSLPLLEEKGDAQIDFSASTTSLRLSGNYAFSKRFALMLNGNLSYKNFTNNYDIFSKEGGTNDINDDSEFAHKYAELGFGWYNILNKPKTYYKIKLEVFAGIGLGRATDQKKGWEESILHYDAEYYTGFIQPNLGILFTKKFTLGLGVRLATSFYDYSYQTNFNNGNYIETLTHSISFRKFSIEPMVMFKAGRAALKFIGQVGLALPFYNEESFYMISAGRGIDNGYLNTTSVHLSIGIHYTFGNRKNKDAIKNEY